MSTVVCPHCSRAGKLKAPVAEGAKVRCPGCQKLFIVHDEAPEEIDLGIAFDDGAGLGSPSGPAPAFVPSGVPAPASPAAPGSAAFAPAEPWFYGWLDRFARVAWGLAKLVAFLVPAGCGVALIGVALATRATPEQWFTALGVLLYVALATVGFLLPAFLWSALLMLAVDAARNVRAARYRG